MDQETPLKIRLSLSQGPPDYNIHIVIIDYSILEINKHHIFKQKNKYNKVYQTCFEQNNMYSINSTFALQSCVYTQASLVPLPQRAPP